MDKGNVNKVVYNLNDKQSQTIDHIRSSWNSVSYAVGQTSF